MILVWLVLMILAAALLWEAYFAGVFKLIRERKRLERNLSHIAGAIGLKGAHTETSRKSGVAAIAIRIAQAMHLPGPEVRRIRLAALLHDIGKVGVSAKIIGKPGPLDPAEQEEMRRHPVIGEEILRPVELLSDIAGLVRHHHEHYDGSGYPDRLKGEDIPLGSRIIMVANAFSCITSDTPYRKARSKSEALHELTEHVGTQFDPEVVRVFESLIDLV